MSGSMVTVSLGDGLPRGIQSILLQYDTARRRRRMARSALNRGATSGWSIQLARRRSLILTDRKSTRLNSSHTVISYAVFCLKKKKDTVHVIGVRLMIARE